MSYYILDKISTYSGFFIIGLMSFTLFNKKFRMIIKNKLKKFQFLYYGSLFALFVLTGNLSHYFNEKQLFTDFSTFKSEFIKIHDINEKYFKMYLLNFEEPIRMELMSKVDPLVAVFDVSFEKYAKETGKYANDIKLRYKSYVKAGSKELKDGLEGLRDEVLPIYNIYKLPFQNNNPTATEVDKDGNIIPVVNDINGKVKELLYYDSSYKLVPFKNFNGKQVLFNLVKDDNNYFKEVMSIYFLDENNVRIPIDYYKNNIDTSPYYIDLKDKKDSFLKSIKIKKEYSSYITEKAKMQELIKKDKLDELKDFLDKNKNIFTLNTIFSDGNPSFTYAMLTKSKSTQEYFLENGFNINLLDKDLKTVLHIALINGHNTEFLKKLIEKGVDLGVKDAFGKYAVDYAKVGSDEAKYLNSIINKKIN